MAQRVNPLESKTYQSLKTASDLPSFIDRLLDLPSDKVDRHLEKFVLKSGETTVAGVARQLTKRYLKHSALVSGSVGASAAIPVSGTGVALGLTAGELGSYYLQTLWYILQICRLHGLKVEDQEARRVLVTSALMGEEGAKLVSQELNLATLAWARHSLTSLSSPTMRQVNKYLAKYAAKRGAKTGAKRMLGRLVPFGIGAAIGYFSGRKAGKKVVSGLQAALGPIRDLSTADFLVELANEVV